MKAVLIGSDFLLDDNGNARLVELNTSAGIYQSMLPHLDFSGLESLLQANSIVEVVEMIAIPVPATSVLFKNLVPLSLTCSIA